MLLRGVKFGPPALDNADIQGVKSKAQHSGRSFGGAPLRNGGSDRGGHINFASDRPNPFAAHLDPTFVPPPNLSAPMMPSGWVPPVPGSAGFSRGPPGPPRGGRSGSYRPPYPPAGPPQTGYGQGYYPPYNQPAGSQPGYGGNHRGGGYGNQHPGNRGGYGRY